MPRSCGRCAPKHLLPIRTASGRVGARQRVSGPCQRARRRRTLPKCAPRRVAEGARTMLHSIPPGLRPREILARPPTSPCGAIGSRFREIAPLWKAIAPHSNAPTARHHVCQFERVVAKFSSSHSAPIHATQRTQSPVKSKNTVSQPYESVRW